MSKQKIKKTNNPLANQGPFFVLLAPFLLFFFVFTILPVLSSIVLSFTDFNMVTINNFVGLITILDCF